MSEEILRSLAARTGGRCRIAVAAPAQCDAPAFLSALARACGGEDAGAAQPENRHNTRK